MNWLDLLIALVLLYFILKGLKRGFLREALGLIGLFIAFMVATVKMGDGVGLISRYVAMPAQLATVISFVLIFLVVLLVFRIAAELIRRLLSFSFLGWIDRLGGVALGFVKGSLIVSLVLLFVPLLPLPFDFSSRVNESVLAGPTRGVAPAVFGLVKSGFPRAKLFYEQLQQSIDRGKSNREGE